MRLRVSGLQAQAVWTGQWEADLREAWERQVSEATSRKKVRGPAGEVSCEVKKVGQTVPRLQFLRRRDGKMIRMKETCPEAVKHKHWSGVPKRFLGSCGQRSMKLENSKKEFGLNQSKPC